MTKEKIIETYMCVSKKSIAEMLYSTIAKYEAELELKDKEITRLKARDSGIHHKGCQCENCEPVGNIKGMR